MVWSSILDPTTSSSLISRRHSIAYGSFDGSLTRPSASLACLKENYSGSLSVTEELKPTRKRSALTTMDAPRMIKDVQKLIGYMAALNRFISHLGERGLPFFKFLKCHNKF
jgi:hypothetical protein